MINKMNEIVLMIDELPLSDKINAINHMRKILHEVSPFKNEPIDLVIWVPKESVHANDYNPNSTASSEQELLRLSIDADGITQPVVTMPTGTEREVIDGFHRTRVIKENKVIGERVHGYVPVVTINTDREDKADRMAATIRHNRARGKHKIEAMSDIVMDLKKRNWSDTKIAKQLGMDPDEVLRLAQITGLSEMFKDRDFSKAWEIDEIENDANQIIEP